MGTELITFTDEDKKIIKSQFFPPTATPQDMQYCMGVAKSLGLNPITKQIWFVERKANINGQWVSKIEPMAGRDSYLAIAHKSGQFAGIETEARLENLPILNSKGEWEERKELVAICKVYKKGMERPFVSSVNYNEYVQRTKTGVPTKFWKEKPHTMLKKVAESQALRKAFDISGVYDEVEIRNEQQDEITNVEIVEDTVDQLKRSIALKLRKHNIIEGDIKLFAEKFNLSENVELLRELVNDENKLLEKVDLFEKGE